MKLENHFLLAGDNKTFHKTEKKVPEIFLKTFEMKFQLIA